MAVLALSLKTAAFDCLARPSTYILYRLRQNNCRSHSAHCRDLNLNALHWHYSQSGIGHSLPHCIRTSGWTSGGRIWCGKLNNKGRGGYFLKKRKQKPEPIKIIFWNSFSYILFPKKIFYLVYVRGDMVLLLWFHGDSCSVTPVGSRLELSLGREF